LKNGLKPTLKQKKIMQKNNMDESMWFVSKVLSDRLLCVHKFTEDTKEAFYKVG
jgi:hypothetical protein